MSWIVNPGAIRRLAVLAAIAVAALLACYFIMIRMPGESFRGPLPALTAVQRDAAVRLRTDVEAMTRTVGQRSTYHVKALAETALALKQQLEAMGYDVLDHSFPERGAACPNLQVEVRGSVARLASQIVLVGAHYDAYQGTPGADDNASGVAGVLELARRLKDAPRARTVRLVLFVNEEPPSFMTADMGSLVYARKARADGDDIVAMLSLESIGYYRDEPGSQKYPPPLGWFYPTTGNFIAFVGDVDSRGLVQRSIAAFREGCRFPSEGAALPSSLPGIGWSDHWAFWQVGYPAIMVTATAPFRNPNYHEAGDTASTLDYERLARVIDGVQVVVEELATGSR